MEDHNIENKKLVCFNDKKRKNNLENILTAIAKEIQSGVGEGTNEDRNIFFKTVKYKVIIKRKKSKIKKLKRKIQILCVIAKLLAPKKNNNNIQEKNYTNNLHDFINQGYEMIQKTLNDQIHNISTLEKLKKILLCWQKNYGNLYEERTRCEILEQRHRFHRNKINILENNLDSLNEDNKNMRYQLMKLQKENKVLKNKILMLVSQNPNCPRFYIASGKGATRELIPNLSSFNLKSHLSLINNLLFDQKLVLQDLEKISKDVEIIK